MIAAIDGTNYLHVLWHALDGDVSKVRSAMFRRVDLLRGTWPSIERLVVAFDAPPSFRHSLHVGYKSSRKESKSELKAMLRQVQQDMDFADGAIVLAVEGYEADDVLATVARIAVESGRKAVLASPDKDLRQCLKEGQVTILRHWKTQGGVLVPEWETAAKLLADYGLFPYQWKDYQVMVGDPGDDIPGINGIGDKTARRLLAEHGSLEVMLADPWKCKVTDAQRRELFSVKRNSDRLATIRRLVTLADAVPGVAECLGLEPVGA